jgi:signal transduction histidine kinase/ActR/RegA family two-component response regulator
MSDWLWGSLVWLAGVGAGIALWQLRAARAARRPGRAPSAASAADDGAVGAADEAAREAAARKRLVLAQRLEAVGRLAGGAAHDFNNLLGVIIGHAELARAASADNPPVRARLEQMLAAAQRAADVTRQLLAFSRRQVLEPRVLDLNAEVGAVEPALRAQLRSGLALVTRLDPQLGPVRADPIQIRQVLLNLAANARDALPERGTLTIETRNVVLDEAYAREHEPLAPGSYVELRVSDDGRGMEASVREHAFEPYFSTKPDGVGSGLSLSTVYGIVKQSGGYIWVESAPGRGTTFTIQLPRRVEAVDVVAAPSDTPAAGARTILVVEDESGLRDLICEVLEEAGHRVLSAASGPSAIALSQGFAEPIHLLISDVIMPGMSGPELVGRLVRQRPSMRALLISGYTQDAMTASGISGTSFTLLRKPFTGTALLEHVGAALARS